jgi:hypothetical protein
MNTKNLSEFAKQCAQFALEAKQFAATAEKLAHEFAVESLKQAAHEIGGFALSKTTAFGSEVSVSFSTKEMAHDDAGLGNTETPVSLDD